VGIAVKDYQQSVDFYNKVMGFRKAFGDEIGRDGKPGTIYLQTNRDSFLEIAQADTMPVGITYVGLQVQIEDSLVSTLSQRGAMVSDSRISRLSARQNWQVLSIRTAFDWSSMSRYRVLSSNKLRIPGNRAGYPRLKLGSFRFLKFSEVKQYAI
jgi:hypothetical protein